MPRQSNGPARQAGRDQNAMYGPVPSAVLKPSITVATLRPKKNGSPQSKLCGAGFKPARPGNAVTAVVSVSALTTMKFWDEVELSASSNAALKVCPWEGQ